MMKIKKTMEKKDAFAKRGFGSGDGRANLPEVQTEKSWRMTKSNDSHPKRFVSNEN